MNYQELIVLLAKFILQFTYFHVNIGTRYLYYSYYMYICFVSIEMKELKIILVKIA